MKTLVLLSMSLAVSFGMPPFAPGVAQSPVLPKEDKNPVLEDVLPVQGHVVVDDRWPQVRQGDKEEQEDTLALDEMTKEKSPSVVEPEVKVEQAGQENLEVKTEQELKGKQEEKPKLEDKGEPVVLETSEVRMEQGLKAEPEVRAGADVKVLPELKVPPVLTEEQKGQENLDAKIEMEQKELPDANERPEVKEKPEVHLESEVKLESVVNKDFKVEPEVMMEPEEVDLEAYIESDPNLNPDVMSELEVDMQPKDGKEQEFKDDSAFKVESEVEVEQDVKGEVEPEVFGVQMDLLPETETGPKFVNKEGKYEMLDEPIMELEPLDEDNMFDKKQDDAKLTEEEKYMRTSFQNQPVQEEEELGKEKDYVLYEDAIMELEPLDEDNMFHKKQNDAKLTEEEKYMRTSFQNQPVQEEEELGKEKDYVLYEDPIMELEPETGDEQNSHQAMPEAAIIEEGPKLDYMEELMPSFEENFPNEEARMGMELSKQESNFEAEGSEYLMKEEPGSEFVKDRGLLLTQDNRATRWSYCPGVLLEEKCYQFFQQPKGAADAEFFCQEHFPGGHLASIMSQHIHREVMKMMLQKNGVLTNAWVGGLRYLDTGRFIWLDGSRWEYSDWLKGEPRNTADRDCVQLLALGKGKFNDSTCWEPQAFICSFPY